MFSPIKKLSKVITVAVPTQTTIYAAGQIVGGLIQLPNFFDSVSGVSEVVSLAVADLAKQNAALTLALFTAKPAGTYTQGATFNPSNADLLLIGAVLSVLTGSYASWSANSTAVLTNLRAKMQAGYNPLQNGPNTVAKSAWLVAISGGTPTYGITNGLTVSFGIEQDV